MAGKFELYKDSGGKFRFRLKTFRQAHLTASPLIVTSLAAVGFAIGVGIGYLTQQETFGEEAHPVFILLGANWAAWFVVLVPSLQRFLALQDVAVWRRNEFVLSLGVFVILSVIPLLPWVERRISGGAQLKPLDYPLLIIGGLAFAIPMAGIWSIHAIARQLQPDDSVGDLPPGSVRLYLTLQDDLRTFLWMVGVVISLGTLAIGFAAQALSEGHARVSRELVWAYGLYYTAILALSYGPTYVALLSVGQSIRDTIVGEMPVDPTKLEGWLQRRQEVGGRLQLSQGPLSNIKAAILVLSPLLSSFLSTALEASR